MKIKEKFLKVYAEFLSGELKILRKIKIVFDASNGFAGQIIKEAIGGNQLIQPIFINCRPDGKFPAHGPNSSAPGAADELIKEVVQKKADAGFIFDGDGDRVIIADEKGNLIHPDLVIRLYTKHYHPEKIIIDRRIGWFVKEDLRTEEKVSIIKSKIGHLNVKRTMKENGADFGAEGSGHYYFPVEGTYIDSGAIMTMRMMTIISEDGSLSEWVSRQKPYFRSGEISFSVASAERNIKSVADYARKNGFELDFEDGLYAEKEDFRFLLRPAANEPLIRMNAEAKEENVLKKGVNLIQSLISE
ncbi:MAG: hypothetical protein WC565_01315 [Parcubacteria group bacterium]